MDDSQYKAEARNKEHELSRKQPRSRSMISRGAGNLPVQVHDRSRAHELLNDAILESLHTSEITEAGLVTDQAANMQTMNQHYVSYLDAKRTQLPANNGT